VNIIGIRAEDKSRWETRAPLVPEDVQHLVRDEGIGFTVQSSPRRVFTDEAYRDAGASIAARLDDCPIILGIKEIPPEKFEPRKTYLYFSHTIKGQSANMPALRRLMELKCQLIDYERITDDAGRRLVFFGTFAGRAGMIDSLWALGRRLADEGIDSPFAGLQPAHRYRNLDHAKQEIASAGEAIRRNGLPAALGPLVCGFTGYGQVSQGAQEVFAVLPVEELAPDDLAAATSAKVCYKVVFREEHMVRRLDPSATFNLPEYYKQPERYASSFFRYVPHLTLLLNCIYWEPKYPRLITREQFGELYAGRSAPRLRVVGDISCDIDGSVACTVRATTPDSPIYVYDPRSGETRDGVSGHGPVVLAIDFLPCELPVDASEFFSTLLRPFMPSLARADFAAPLSNAGLAPVLQRAAIVYHGALTEPYGYLKAHLTGI